MDANKNQSIDVLMFPWLGYGHITPYLELAKKLTGRGFNIYLCSTPATLCCIDKKITGKMSQSIKLVPLFLPPLPGLPAELHTTNGLPPHLMPRLKEAFDLSVNDFSNILKQLKPHLLIYDFLQPWAPAEAMDLSFLFEYYFRDYEYSNMTRFRDIEGKYIDYVTSLVGKKFVPVGPLVQEPSPDEKEDESSCIFSWLDMKERKSTVFVSFGSEYFLTKEDIDEIAYGLELSKINFIWVVRFPKGANGNNGLLEKTLPRGFLERVGDRGKILEGWAPQTKILGHENIGGFVSHCGWNSVIESMNFGVPIIAVPMHLDQPINARLVEEVGVGVEVVRDRNKRLSRGRLAAVIKQVVMEDCGEVVRQRAAEMREKLKSKGDQEIDEVVKELVMVCNNS
ncbi:UNVERIFIED_CONTAM: Beta-D-glucosyl crocetin beta-1,6-glucosyltransferase [Sesamum radiatum]|uniref:Beta-D-glucosyl crocetin beta-1,6-glucosyltransferase n=1 Tax=Sesamum radiatum TaxID=300843 RepID=A0AAW2TJ65_SESRA